MLANVYMENTCACIIICTYMYVSFMQQCTHVLMKVMYIGISSSSFLLRQAFADDEAIARSLQCDISLALSVVSRMSMPCASMSSIILSIHVFVFRIISSSVSSPSTWLCSAI